VCSSDLAKPPTPYQNLRGKSCDGWFFLRGFGAVRAVRAVRAVCAVCAVC
jgi:hypothetical protein